MYQSTQAQSGVFNFKDFNIQPPIECYKACRGCASEKSVGSMWHFRQDQLK
jgi:hypothetical protein